MSTLLLVCLKIFVEFFFGKPEIFHELLLGQIRLDSKKLAEKFQSLFPGLGGGSTPLPGVAGDLAADDLSLTVEYFNAAVGVKGGVQMVAVAGDEQITELIALLKSAEPCPVLSRQCR